MGEPASAVGMPLALEDGTLLYVRRSNQLSRSPVCAWRCNLTVSLNDRNFSAAINIGPVSPRHFSATRRPGGGVGVLNISRYKGTGIQSLKGRCLGSRQLLAKAMHRSNFGQPLEILPAFVWNKVFGEDQPSVG